MHERPVVRVRDLPAARRWLDSSASQTGGQDGAGGQAWIGRAAASDAEQIGSALSVTPWQAAARRWLLAVAPIAPVHLLAGIGGALVDAAAVNEAEAVLRRGAEAGDVPSARDLGRLLLFSGKEEEAGHWLRQVFETDPDAARAVLTDLRARGALEIADRWAREAAERGDGRAAIDLAWSAARKGDTEETARWLAWADDLGHPGTDQERRDITELLAAEQGPGPRSHRLGVLALEAGDREQAHQHFLAAARAGLARSMAALAELQRTPDARDRWQVLAAAHGDAGSALRTGLQELDRGRPEEALHWFRLAQELGEPAAAAAISRLAVARPDGPR